MEAIENKNSLRRSISLPLICLYGLGNILGAGIYVLIGKVAGEAGNLAPLSFFLASLIAGITAFSFAELSSRYPLSAGEAVYIQKGFGIKQLSLAIGLLIIATGIVSSATISKGFVGYLDVFIELPDWSVVIILISMLALIAIWGISESVTAAALFTLLEIGGLLLILWVTAPAWDHFPARLLEDSPDFSTATLGGLFSGAFLAFYAYVGFEDMVNVAEEVKNPRRNMPIAILLSLALATILYILVSTSSLLVLSPAELSQSDAPLASIYQSITGSNPWLISLVSLFAVVNGALIQIIMGSRVCYGLAQQNWLPVYMGRVNSKTRTPVNATLIVSLIIMLAALTLPIETLANATTYLLLMVFSLVNLALIRIKLGKGEQEENEEISSAEADYFQVNIIVPVCGLMICILFLLGQTFSLLLG